MRKKQVLSIIIACFLSILVFKQTATASEIGKTYIAVNDQLISFKKEKSYVLKKVTYAPISFYSKLGIKRTENKAKHEVYLVKGKKKITLNTKKNTLHTDKGKSKTYVLTSTTKKTVAPFEYVGSYFGYKISHYSKGPITRATNSKAKLTDAKLYKKYQKTFASEKKAKKIAYLTFDDGPNSSVDRIITILDQYKAKATFFMLNNNMKVHSKSVKKMAKQGHGLACHGVTHDKNKFYHSPNSAVNEMKTCLSTLKKVSSAKSVMIRVPYGSVPYMTKPYRDQMDKSGYKMWDWNVDSLDWKWLSGPKTADYTIQQIKDLKKRGMTPLILMHDKPTTADALPKILKYLKDNGYETKPLTNEMKPYNFYNRIKL
ncbi:polysaccharide deacetylase family protein [Heyndrickxia sporothermodurans]